MHCVSPHAQCDVPTLRRAGRYVGSRFRLGRSTVTPTPVGLWVPRVAPSALLRGTAAWGRADPAAGTGLRRLPSHASPSQRRVRRDPHRPASSRSQALVYRCLGPGPWSRGCPSPAAPGPPEPASRLLWAGGGSSCAWGLGLGSCWVLAADTPPRGRSPGKDTRRRGRTGLVSEVTFAVFSSVEAAR